MKTFYRGLLMAVFALWFGGFTFYTAFVVPIGTDLLGSPRAQGFITQQVTNWMNLIGAFAILFCLLELVVERRMRTKSKNVILAMIVSGIALFHVGLLYLHPLLDDMIVVSDIDVFENDITDEEQFYQMHRAYLWISTFQWGLCWIWLFMTIHDWTRGSRATHDSKARSSTSGDLK